MAQSKGLYKFLEFIGIVDRDEAEASARERMRYRAEETYEPQRYTPGPARRTENEDTRGANRFSQPARPAAESRRPRSGEGRPRFRAESHPQSGSLARADRKLKVSSSTMVYYLHSLSECSSVIQDLISGNSVLLNLEETDTALMQRIVDTLAGASFALNAKIRKVSEKMYLIAPENVQVNMTTSVERRY